MRTPKEEREISVGGYVYDKNGSKAGTVKVYTSDYSYMQKFDRFCKSNPEEWAAEEIMLNEGDVVGKRYKVNTGCILFREKTQKGRARTEEEKNIARERMMRLHEMGVL